MYKFDDNFLAEVGLADLPSEQKAGFLEYAQDQLEIRVGEKMSNGLSDAQIEEFEKIIEGDQESVAKILAEYGDYKNDEIYKRMLDNGAAPDHVDVDYASAMWLSKNCPNYQEIIQSTQKELAEEIKANKDAILTA